MRNPFLLFPIGLILILTLGGLSVFFGYMSANEFFVKLRTLLLILTPVIIIVGVTAFYQRKSNDDTD